MSDIDENDNGDKYVDLQTFSVALCLMSSSAVVLSSEDDGGHNEPFDVTAVPQSLSALDAPPQEDVQMGIYARGDTSTYDHVEAFNTTRPAKISFNQLHTLREKGDQERAMRCLSARHRLEIDAEHRLDPTDPNMVVAAGPHFLDFVMYIGSRRGLDAVLPNMEADQTWSLELNLTMPQRLWPSGKPSKLPFNPNGRLLYIGQRGQEQVWLAMVPNEWLEEDHPFNASGNWPTLPAQTTAMATKHSLMVTMFIAKAFSDRRLQDFHCQTVYPEDLTRESINDLGLG